MVLLFFILTWITAEKKVLPELNQSYHNVINVVDGDTIDVNINGETKRIRLIGIDAPEMSENECYNNESFEKIKELLLNKKVSLEVDSTQDDKDKYNRLLRYVFLEDGTNLNLYMIKNGYAVEYTYNKPYKYQLEFKEAQALAKSETKGLWNETSCDGKSNEYKEPVEQSQKTVELVESTFSETIQTKNIETIQPAKTEITKSFGSCGSKTKCGEMLSCEEAYYYLKSCGVTRLDGDKDGIPCESICL